MFPMLSDSTRVGCWGLVADMYVLRYHYNGELRGTKRLPQNVFRKRNISRNFAEKVPGAPPGVFLANTVLPNTKALPQLVNATETQTDAPRFPANSIQSCSSGFRIEATFPHSNRALPGTTQ